MAPLNAVWRIRRHLSPERSSDVQEAVLGTYLLALPLVPFMHGDQVNIAKGTEFGAAFAERIALDRAEIERLQPQPSPPRPATATLTFYDVDENRAHPTIWCGKVKLGELLARTRYTIELPPGTYWARTESKKSTLLVVVEPGGEYFIRISSVMNGGTSSHPGYTRHIEAVKHDSGGAPGLGYQPAGFQAPSRF